MNDIEQRIRNRSYLSPGRARAGLSRSLLTKSEKARMGELIDEWEAEGAVDPVVGGLPTTVTVIQAPPKGRPDIFEALSVNVNVRVRARLTVHGIAKLHAKRGEITVPADLVSSGGVWETELWQFMALFGGATIGDEPVTVDNVIELLNVRG
jgi:hypothetical protein